MTISKQFKYHFLWLCVVVCGVLLEAPSFAQRITDPSHTLDVVWKQIKECKEPVSIVHLGDSHVQAGFFSQPLRRTLEQKCDLSGYGWVGGHKLYGSNQVGELKFLATPRRWATERLTQVAGCSTPGPGGLVFKPGNAHHLLNIETQDGSLFNRVLVYRTADTAPMQDYDKAVLRGSCRVNDIIVDTLELRKPSSSITLQGNGRNAKYFGWQLMNTEQKLLFHAIGLNGARLDHYAVSQYTDALQALRPRLIIVSLGSNDAYTYKWETAEVEWRVRSLIQKLRESCPDVRLLLTTPPPAYIRKAYTVRRNRKRVKQYHLYPNENTRKMAELIMRIAGKEHCAAFNLYGALGGIEVLPALKKSGEISADGIHYSHQGYARHGKLLATALLKSMNSEIKTQSSPMLFTSSHPDR